MRPHVLIALGTLAAAPAAADQTRTTSVPTGKETVIHAITALKRDCSAGTVGSFRVLAPPKSGAVTIRSANRKTPASFRCPNVQTAVQELVYEPKAKFTGADEVSLEITNADGGSEKVLIKLNVGSGAKPGA